MGNSMKGYCAYCLKLLRNAEEHDNTYTYHVECVSAMRYYEGIYPRYPINFYSYSIEDK